MGQNIIETLQDTNKILILMLICLISIAFTSFFRVLSEK